mgnify:CR=1 FL=1
MSQLKLAILGAGRIAETMAETVRQMDDVCLYAVAAREEARAKAFASVERMTFEGAQYRRDIGKINRK